MKCLSTSRIASRPTPSCLPSRRPIRLVCSSKNNRTPSVPDRDDVSDKIPATILCASTLLSPFLFNVQSALATSGEFGLLEGRTAALIHPATMFYLFAATGYAGYLGWQWRRTREVGDEIRELRKQVPAAASAEASVAVPSSAESGTSVSDIIVSKEKERKELLAGNFKDKHAMMGSIILASGTGIAIEGCVNTFMRTGKLFPGPHLYAGATMVALWALATALVPEMQKGNNNARTAHIGINIVNFCLFASQIPTGWEIVGKVFEFTQWP